jgi:hypothetical protein
MGFPLLADDHIAPVTSITRFLWARRKHGRRRQSHETRDICLTERTSERRTAISCDRSTARSELPFGFDNVEGRSILRGAVPKELK